MTILQKVPMESIKAAQNPIEQASGLPNAAYDDPELFEFERDNVLAKTWAGLDFASELPHNSYAKPIDFMGLPILMLRDNQGQLKVFHNVCSHRGMILVEEAGPVRNLLRCPYHSWSYDLTGNLKSTPHIGGVDQNKAAGFNCEANGLKEIASAQWMGIIFINLSGDAESFAEYIEPLLERWEKFTGKGGFDLVKPAENFSNAKLDIKANWKLALENYCEAYHLPWVHPGLNSYSPLDQHQNLLVNENMSGQISLNYQLSEVSGHSLPKFPEWPQDKATVGEYISLYPNLLLGLQLDHTFAVIVQPKAPNHSLEKLQISYIGEGNSSHGMADCREKVRDAWIEVFEEDVFAVERMQKGRKSPGFKGGVFSPVLDVPSHVFHSWVANKYENALS